MERFKMAVGILLVVLLTTCVIVPTPDNSVKQEQVMVQDKDCF